MELDQEPPVPDQKLCGYLCAVLTVASSSPPPRAGTRLRVVRHNASVAFTSADGVVLSPPRSDAAPETVPEVIRTPAIRRSGKKRKATTKGGDSAEGKRTLTARARSAGMVNGSVSVAEQLHALVAHKCLSMAARVVGTEAGDGGGGGEVRVVVLVDVYLPVEVWSGWQFPRSGSVAGALFQHLSCDWEQRRSIIASEDYVRGALAASSKMWNLSDCHVLGCELHHNVAHPRKKKLFELHEIFKGLPSVATMVYTNPSRIQPVDDAYRSGLWDLSDDILIKVLAPLGPVELVRVAGTCHHLRFLAALIMPCMKLKLFPHQQAAVKWMLQREQHPKVLPNPLYTAFSTEDGFAFHVSTVSGEIVSGEAPTINDFRGGLFCDEPGLGKTITALSLILKTRGKLADPPDSAQVTWCTHNGDSRCGYYDLKGAYLHRRKSDVDQKAHTNPEQLGYHSSKRARLVFLNEQPGVGDSCNSKQLAIAKATRSEPAIRAIRSTRGLNSVKKNLIFRLEEASDTNKEQADTFYEVSEKGKRASKRKNKQYENNDTWAQCDSCRKWRKLQESRISDATTAWFCSMNSDLRYQSCSVLEEAYDDCKPITYFHGFCSRGTSGGEDQNVSFFASVLMEHHCLINSATKKALSWLLTLSPDKISEMETVGVRTPFISMYIEPHEDARSFQTIFKSFGLRKVVEKGIVKWFYPRNLQNLVFDTSALRIALSTPLDSIRLYLSKATLVVVPANLVDHWRTQIQKHVRPNHLRVYIWTDHKNPNTHNLAWDYDIIITTFSRLSAEWGSRKRSAMRQVHWLRIILDEGHTLGSSVALTNKLQMAVSLVASNRWILTGTPTPNTPNSQLSHLQPLLKFLHEEAYGQNQKSWETGILKPFEAEMEEGRTRLLHLLHRCMISARKADLKHIPPCIKKVKLLDFTAEHARSYNELAVTVRRNILMADWNDPSHVESLLNPKQWKFRSATIKNVRLSCCVAGHIKVTDAGQDIQETMDVLVETGLDPKSDEYAFIKYNLLDGGNCVRCGEWCRLPVITPCRHLLCQECVALDSERCTVSGCGNSYEMQTPDTLARPENPNPKWPVPKDLIELQPSYKQDNWDPDWQSTSSSKVSYLVSRLKELQAANSDSCRPKDDGANVVAIHDFFGSSWMRNSKTRNRDKVLVFSQFLEHIHVIEQQLLVADINFAGMYSPMQTSHKMKSLTMFQNDEDCMVLLMDGSAALGLDLSFVSHVFLMEPIWDKSMEEQVISRAHRMGATRPIHVETLAMRSTIEEHMLSFLQDAEACRDLLKTEIGKTESEGPRTHRSLHDFAENNYLSRLTFVRTNPKN